MNIGVIGIRGAWSTESLSEQLRNKDAGGAVIELSEISYDLACHRYLHHRYQLTEFDGFIVKKMGVEYSPHLLDELDLLEMMERSGFRFFSSPRSIRKMISRLSCTINLRDRDIPMPPTFITENMEDAVSWAIENAPVVLKPLYSTKARGMALITDESSARESIAALIKRGEKIVYLQKKYDLDGSDYGLIFLGGEYIGAYARISDGTSWHTTTREGGKYGAFDPPFEFIELAERAQRPFGLDFTCVDVANTVEAGPIVFEVSAFGGYKGLHQASGIDASDMLTDYVLRKMRDE